MSSNLLSTIERSTFEDALDSVFQSYKRQFFLYIDAQTAVISTGPSPRFAQHDQNVFNPPVTPQIYTLSGCILHANKEPWEYMEPQTRANYQQLKLRDPGGTVRLKVDYSGFLLMKECKMVDIDGIQFMLNSTARPHGLLTPIRYSFNLTNVQ